MFKYSEVEVRLKLGIVIALFMKELILMMYDL